MTFDPDIERQIASLLSRTDQVKANLGNHLDGLSPPERVDIGDLIVGMAEMPTDDLRDLCVRSPDLLRAVATYALVGFVEIYQCRQGDRATDLPPL